MSGTFARREQRHDRAHGRTQRSWSHRLLNLLQSLLLWGLTLALLLLSSACEPFGRTGPGPALEQTASAPKRASVSPTPTPIPRPVEQYGFQKGIVYPGWSRSAYGLSDRRWQESLQEIRRSTAAEWLEMPVLFSQSTPDTVDIGVDQAAPSVASFVAGVRKAHEVGFKVFLAPLLTVRQPGGWAALVMPAPENQQRWFDHYWQALRPYVEAAEANGVEQIALATEMEWLQSNASSTLWRQLIERVRSIYTGNLTYDINWSTMDQPPAWLRDPRLTFIGVSEYISLSEAPVRLDAQTMIELWREQIKTRLDQLAEQLNRRIVITEIGYRNSADALYQVWSPTSTAPADPQEQADAYNAALTNVMTDEHLAGIFFWGWDGVARFSIRGQKASEVLHRWYSGSHTGPAGS
jgi:hypothetical protein